MMKTAIVEGKFSPFTKTDRKVLREYLSQGYEAVYVRLLEDEVSIFDRMQIIQKTIKKDPIFLLVEKKEEERILDARLDQGITKKDLSELSKAAAQYSIEHCLYIKDVARRTLSEKRFYHVCCVADLASALAVHYDIPYYKGYAAGLLHDITKEWSKPKQRRYMEKYYPEKVENHPKTYHQHTAQKFVQLKYQVEDEEILDAIGNHVNGTDEKLLSRIVFCSDKIDDSRGFDNSEFKKMCFEDIDKAYEVIRDQQFKYLRKVLQEEKKKNG